MELQEVTYVHVFLPIQRLREYDTMALITWLSRAYPQVKIVVSKSDFVTGEMTHYIWNSDLRIVPNEWGIPEPVDAPELVRVSPALLDMVVVPLLICDSVGNRIGYGKGFYDRFLQACRNDVLKVGVNYFPPLAEVLERDEWDIPLDKLVFPEDIISFPSG